MIGLFMRAVAEYNMLWAGNSLISVLADHIFWVTTEKESIKRYLDILFIKGVNLHVWFFKLTVI